MEIYRRIRAKAARSRIRVPRVWWWHLGLRPEDAIQASIPRSGSTWLRFILFQILTGEDAGFGNIELRLPEIDAHRGIPPILPSGGRLIKTHEKYRKEYKKAVYLVRDVRDVILSSWVRSIEVGLAPFVSDGDFDSFLLSFLKGKVLPTGSWQEHVHSWLNSPLAENGNLLLVRYEDLRKRPEEVLGGLLQFLGVTPDAAAIRRAIESNTVQRMRAKEDKARKAGEPSSLLGNHKSAEEDGRFVRKGAVGGWRAKLTDAQVKVVQEYAGETLLSLGYAPGLTDDKRTSEPAVSVLGR